MKRITTLVVAVGALAACSDRSGPLDVAPPAQLNAGTPIDHSAKPFDIAVIGDVPYGSAAIALFPTLVKDINADPKVRTVVHVGDFKSGSEVCSDARFQTAADLFETFKDPLVYAIGDNEWTDCHRANNGGYDPLGRLAKLRSLFFPVPGEVLGGRGKRVLAQDHYPENQLWVESRVTFSVLHILGSNNGLAPWFGAAETPAQTAARTAEVAARQAANLAWLDHTFETAEDQGSVGIVLFYQADLWHPDDRADGAEFTGHQTFVERLAELAGDFDGPVLLIVGDSHDYRVDPGVPWMSTYYGVTAPSNLTQIVVDRTIESPPADGGTQSAIEWLRLHVDPNASQVFTWTQVIEQ